MEKASGDVIVLHMCSKNNDHMMYASWDMEIVFCHFRPFWTLVYHKWRSYDLLVLRYQEQQNFLSWFFALWPPTLSPPFPNTLQNQNFGKMKKRPGDIILQLCTTNDDHMMYGSWDMECDGQNFLSFWTIYCSFIPLNVSGDMERDRQTFLSFWTIFCSFAHMYSTNYDYMMYSSWDRLCNRQMNWWTDRQKKWHREVELAKM